MTPKLDYAALRAIVGQAKREGVATDDGSTPKPVEQVEKLPPIINPELPDWLLASMHATREAEERMESGRPFDRRSK
jgi:hypothetical protein